MVSLCVTKYFQELHQILTSPKRSVISEAAYRRARVQELLTDEKMIPVTACWQLIQHFLQVDKEALLDEKCGYSEGPLSVSLSMATDLFCRNVLVDVTQVFQAAAHIC